MNRDFIVVHCIVHHSIKVPKYYPYLPFHDSDENHDIAITMSSSSCADTVSVLAGGFKCL